MKRLLIILLTALAASLAFASPPETVAVTYRFTPEGEKALLRAIREHRAVTRKLGLVGPDHRLYRGDGFFLEIFTWKDASIPDDPPPEVRKVWDELERRVDRSKGKAALEVEEIRPVGLAK
jgi:hypothetical protein